MSERNDNNVYCTNCVWGNRSYVVNGNRLAEGRIELQMLLKVETDLLGVLEGGYFNAV